MQAHKVRMPTSQTGTPNSSSKGLRILSLAACLCLYAPASDAQLTDQSYDVRAQLAPSSSVEISSAIPGLIDTLPVQEGTVVAEGDVLFTLDCEGTTAARRRASARYTAAKAEMDANKRLDARNAIAKVDVQISTARTSEAAAEIRMIDAELKHCERKAPFAGQIAELVADQHQYIEVGEPILQLVATDSLEVELIVPSIWLRWLTKETPFTLYIEEVDQEYQAQVAIVSPVVDSVSQTVRLIGTITNSDDQLRPGMSGIARFTAPENHGG